MKKLLVILGQTATGKTDLALSLAKKFNGELISCDSRQVYTGLDIGTGKLPGTGYPELVSGSFHEMPKRVRHDIKKGNGFWEINGIKTWMYDVVDPKNQFTVKDYVERAEKVIEDIHKRNKLPIIVGGTGFYLKALLEGLPNLSIPVDEKLRRELQNLSLIDLQKKLQQFSPSKWESLNESDRQNPRRLLRSIELITMYPHIKTTQNSIRQLADQIQNYRILKIGLTAPRDVFNRRIDARLISRIDQGMIKEAEKLYKNGLSFKRMRQLGLEYGMLADLLEHKITQEQFADILGRKICQYAKRQMTWFRIDKNINWFDITEKNGWEKIDKIVSKWYH